MRVILLSRDLMLSSQLAGPVSRFESKLEAKASADDVIEDFESVDKSPSLLLVDLALPGLDIDHFVSQVRRSAEIPPRIVAFGPHVHEDRLVRAQEAGCDMVLSRGQFVRGMAEILSQILTA